MGNQELLANLAEDTLSVAINNSVTSLTPTSATEFPSTGNFRIRIDDELMLVTAVAAGVFTVVRGIEGTAAASHLINAAIRMVLTKGALEALVGIPIVKAADEDVTSSTTLQDDNELATPALVSGTQYFFEAMLVVKNPVSTGGNFKMAWGEDATSRGTYTGIGTNTSGNASNNVSGVTTGQTQAYITVSTGFTVIRIQGVFTSNGGAFKLQWAQNTSNGNAVRVYAGSWLRYRAV